MTRLRPFESADLEACYAISLATGFEGGDASHLYRDPKMMGHIYVAPYAVLEPSLAFVADDQSGVAGYAVGTADTTAWEERLEREWWPSLRRQYADPVEQRTADDRRAFMIHHPAPTSADIAARFPAHLHMNLLPRLQRRGIGSALLNLWLGKVAGNVHVAVNRANTGGARFWAAQGFETVAERDRTVWMGMTRP